MKRKTFAFALQRKATKYFYQVVKSKKKLFNVSIKLRVILKVGLRYGVAKSFLGLGYFYFFSKRSMAWASFWA